IATSRPRRSSTIGSRRPKSGSGSFSKQAARRTEQQIAACRNPVRRETKAADFGCLRAAEPRMVRTHNLTRRSPMAIENGTLEAWRPRVLAVLRIVTGYLLIPHGTAKLF